VPRIVVAVEGYSAAETAPFTYRLDSHSS